MQQDSLLREKFPDMDVNPRKQSVLDMQLFITKKQREGYYIILSADGNENLSANRKGFCPVESDGIHAFNKDHDGSILTLLNTCGLVDILQEQHIFRGVDGSKGIDTIVGWRDQRQATA